MNSASNFSELIDRTDIYSVFKNEEIFSSNYIPTKLLHREEEMKTLVNYFRSIWTNPTASSRKVVIYGAVGTGKTVVSKSFCNALTDHLQKEHKPRKSIFRSFHLNCRKTKSPSLILTTVLRQIVPGFPLRGFSVEELLRMLTLLIFEQNLVILLVLDEIDYLIPNERTEFLYALSRLEESSPTTIKGYNYTGETNESRFNLLAITRDPNFRYYLDSSTASSLGKNIITFPKYTKAALFDIILNRAELGLQEGSYDDDVLDTISSLSEEYGDARFAIDLLWRSAKVCDQEKSRKITVEYVRRSIVSVLPVEKKIIDDLHIHHKLILLSIARLLQNDSDLSVTTPQVKSLYNSICEEAGIQPRRQTQLWTYIKDLGRFGLINLSVENRHTKGRSQGRVTKIKINSLPIEEIISSLNYLVEK